MARRAPPGGPRRKEKRKPPQIRADTYEEALGMFLAGDVPRSLKRFTAMARDDPGSPDGHAGLGFALSWAADGRKALPYLEKARELGDERPHTLLCMGNARKLLDEYDGAAECFRAALAARPDFAPAHANMAYVHIKLGAHGAAVESADKAREHDPESPEAAAITGIALAKAGMRREAAVVLAEAARDHPGSYHARLGAAYARLDGGDARGFLESLEGANYQDPRDPAGNFKRGRKLEERGDHAAAYRAYAEAARAEPTASAYAAMAASLVRARGDGLGEPQRGEALELTLDAIGKDSGYTYMSFVRARLKAKGRHGGKRGPPRTRLEEGLAMLDAGDAPGALSHFRALAAQEPGLADARVYLAQALVMSGEAGQALAEYEEALKLDGGNTIIYHNMGNAYGSLGMNEKAEECYRTALHGSAGPTTRVSLAQLYLDWGRSEDAVGAADYALNLNPGDWKAHALRGEALSDLQRPRESAQSLDRAAQLAPGSFWARMRLGEALSYAGRADGALRFLDEAARLGPDSADAHHARGVALARLGRFQEAREACARAADLCPSPQIYADLSLATWSLPGGAKTAEALALADKALGLDPGCALAHFAKSRMLAADGRISEADGHLSRARALDPDFEGGRPARGAAKRARAAYDAAAPRPDRGGAP